MFIAKNEEGEIVYSEKIKDEEVKNKYKCLECDKVLTVRVSSLGRKHFIHQGNFCPLNESKEHKLGKENLAYWGKKQGYKVNIEEFFKEEKRRGDLYLPEEKKVLELQCSPMGLKEIKKRTRDYEKAGCSLQWVLGKRYALKRKFTKQQVHFFQYHPQLGYYFLLLKENLVLYAHCYHKQGRSVYQKKMISSKKDFLSLWKIEKYYELPCEIKFLNKEVYLKAFRLSLSKGYKNTLKEQEYFYVRHKHLLNLPDIYYELASVTLPFMKGSGIIVHYELLKKVQGKLFTYEELFSLWEKVLKVPNFVYEMPLVKGENLAKSYAKTYLPYLKSQGFCQYNKSHVKFTENFEK